MNSATAFVLFVRDKYRIRILLSAGPTLTAAGCCALEQLDRRQIVVAIINDKTVKLMVLPSVTTFIIDVLFLRRRLDAREDQHCVRQALPADLDRPNRRVQ